MRNRAHNVWKHRADLDGGLLRMGGLCVQSLCRCTIHSAAPLFQCFVGSCSTAAWPLTALLPLPSASLPQTAS